MTRQQPHGREGRKKERERRGVEAYLESLDVLFATPDLVLREPLGQVQLLLNLLGRALDSDREEGRGESGTVRVHGDALALELLRLDVEQERRERAVQRRRVHVAELLRRERRGSDLGLEVGRRQRREGLLDILVEESLLSLERSEVGGDGRELFGLGVRKEIVVELQDHATLCQDLPRYRSGS